jgi:AcrR family transcriptional regulator
MVVMSSVAHVDAPEGLRERKKRLTRIAIFGAAQRLFDERGFEGVTVAEIADAANVSVKTLFTYVRSKEELIFGGGPTVLDAVAAGVRNRRLGETPLVAAAKGLMAAADDGRLEAFALMACSGPEATSRLRALWEDTEDALTLALARPRDGAPERAARRLEAAQIMVLVRAATSEEVRELVVAAERESGEQKARRAALREWIRDAAGSLARGLQASRR